jgi:hypothetical protein
MFWSVAAGGIPVSLLFLRFVRQNQPSHTEGMLFFNRAGYSLNLSWGGLPGYGAGGANCRGILGVKYSGTQHVPFSPGQNGNHESSDLANRLISLQPTEAALNN